MRSYKPYKGMAILALPNRHFPVSLALRILRHSPRPTFNFLWKTFGSDLGNVRRLIRGLERAGKRPGKIGVYLSCGPCRPPRRDGSMWSIFQGVSAQKISARVIAGDSSAIAAFKKEAKELAVLAREYPSIEWRVYPELEDDFDEQAYWMLASAIFDTLGAEAVAKYSVGRNATHPSYTDIRPMEIHTHEPGDVVRLQPRDAVSGDGVDDLPSASVMRLIESRGADLLLWRPEWQGLYPGNLHTPVNKRTYAIKDAARFIKLLRE